MMIKVIYEKEQKNIEKSTIKKITIAGHANFSSIGKDIICSAVSAISNGTINFLKQNYENEITIFFSPSNKTTIKTKKTTPENQLILTFMLFQLQNIANHYPKNLKIIEKN